MIVEEITALPSDLHRYIYIPVHTCAYMNTDRQTDRHDPKPPKLEPRDIN